jgi:hypothetical protein
VNAIQRIGIYATGIAMACLIAAHNPTGGYTTTIAFYDPWPLPSHIGSNDSHSNLSCDLPTREQQDALASQKRYLGQELGHCRLAALDFWEWRSANALLSYLATVRKALAFAAAILLVGLSWLWLFRPPQPHELRREASRTKTASSIPPSD